MCAVCATPIMGHWKFWQVVQVHRRKEDKMNDTISTTKSIDGDFIKKNIKVPAKVTLKYRLSAPLASTPMKTTTQRENPW